jgi:uncharacterized membrane protein
MPPGRRFGRRDAIQQAVAALLLGGGLIVPGDVWVLAAGMEPHNTVAAFGFVGLAYIALYESEVDGIRPRHRAWRVAGVPVRFLTVVALGFGMPAALALGLGLPAVFDATPFVTLNAIVVAGVFATVIGAVADASGDA